MKYEFKRRRLESRSLIIQHDDASSETLSRSPAPTLQDLSMPTESSRVEASAHATAGARGGSGTKDGQSPVPRHMILIHAEALLADRRAPITSSLVGTSELLGGVISHLVAIMSRRC